MAQTADRGQYASDAVGLTIAAAAVTLWLAGARDLLRAIQVARGRAGPAIELTLQSQQPAETPPAPPKPAPRPPSKRRVQPLPAALPVPSAPLPAASEVAPPAAALVAASAPAPTGSPEARPDLEAQYAAALRADIDSRTHAPDSLQYRLRRPSGEVRVRFVLERSGELQEATLLRSSGSSVLDQAALAIVSSGHYPPMPAQAFAGEVRHTFVVTIEFRRANA
jgi:TonB family protein